MKMSSRENVSSLPGFYCLTTVFHDGRPCHIETSPLICSANQ